MISSWRPLRVACLTLLLAGCEGLPSFPTAPSDLARGVSIYEHANFEGESALITTSQRDLKDYDGPCEHTDSGSDGTSTTSYDWNDCVSSIRVAPGWKAVIYRDDDFKGQSFEVTTEAPNLQLVAGSCSHDGLNDCITSIRITAPPGSSYPP